jgi:hypothetical protein
MSVGLQVGPECVPGCGAKASGAAALGSDAAVDGLAGKKIPVPGDSEGSAQSSWHQFLETLGLRSSEEPGSGKEIGAVAVPLFVRPAPGQVLNFSAPASRSNQNGERLAAPRDAPRVRTDFPAGKKAAAAGSKAAVQADDSRKGDGPSTTSAPTAGGQTPAGGLQLLAVSAPEVAASRGAQPPTGIGVRSESFASEFPGARPGSLAASAVDGEANSKGSIAGLAGERIEANSENGPGDATNGELLNAKAPAAASVQEPKSGSTEAASNPGRQVPRRDMNDSFEAVRPDHAATEAPIADAAAATPSDSQPAANGVRHAEYRSALRSGRVGDPLLVRGAERSAHPRAAGEFAGERGFSVMAATEAAAPILVRAPAGMAEASGRPGGWVDAAHVAGNESNALTGEETFARLDAESASQSIHWVQAGAHRAEAGYLDPNLGWVGVRAETSGGAVHAALLPGSPEAAQVLGTHLTGLNAFLAQQHGAHATATIATPEDGRSGAGAQQGNSADGGSGRDEGAGRTMVPASRPSDLAPQTATSATGAADRSIVSDGSAIRRAGTYVSVMA